MLFRSLTRSYFPNKRVLILQLVLLLLSFTNVLGYYRGDDTRRVSETVYDSETGFGDPIIATWSIVPDGTAMPSSYVPDEVPLESDLIARLDLIFGVAAEDQTSDLTQRPWFASFEEALAIYTAKMGVTYVYEPNDDGQALNIHGSGGVQGVRGDLRIGGIELDYALAHSSTVGPYHGSIVFDSYHTWDASSLKGICLHENMHALGFHHAYVNENGSLTVMGYNTNGPQLDDLLGLHRSYGDKYEKASGNDSVVTATDLGDISGGSMLSVGLDMPAGGQYQTIGEFDDDLVSVDSNSDTDVYQFTLTQDQQLQVKLAPRGCDSYEWDVSVPFSGFTYFVYPIENSNLRFRLLDSGGSELNSVDQSSAGEEEDLTVNLSAGVYYIEVKGSSTKDDSNDGLSPTQFYSLQLGEEITDPPVEYDISTNSTVTFDAGSEMLTNDGGLTVWGTDHLKFVDGSNLSSLDFPALGITSWTNTTFGEAAVTNWDGANLSGLNLNFSAHNVGYNDTMVGVDFSGSTITNGGAYNQFFLFCDLTDADFSEVTFNITMFNGNANAFRGTTLTRANFSNTVWNYDTSGTLNTVKLFEGGAGTSSAADKDDAVTFEGANLSAIVGSAKATMIANLGAFDGDGVTAIGAKFDQPMLDASIGWSQSELEAAGWQFTSVVKTAQDISSVATINFDTASMTLSNTNSLSHWDATGSASLVIANGSDFSNVDFTALGISEWTPSADSGNRLFSTTFDDASLSGIIVNANQSNYFTGSSMVGADFSGVTFNMSANQPFLNVDIAGANFSGATFNFTRNGNINMFRWEVTSGVYNANADFSNTVWNVNIDRDSRVADAWFSDGAGATSAETSADALSFVGADINFSGGGVSISKTIADKFIQNLGGFADSTEIGAFYDDAFVTNNWESFDYTSEAALKTALDDAGWQFVAPVEVNGVPVSWLTGYGFEATEAATLSDTDGDGKSAKEEYEAGTDPTDVNSLFEVSDIQFSGNLMDLTWQAVSGKSYRILFSPDLSPDSWTVVESSISGVEPTTIRTVDTGSGVSGFYVVEVESE